MSARCIVVPLALWRSTWAGLRARGRGVRESACVWVGTRSGMLERARDVIFLDDLPGTMGHALQHRTSREAVAALLTRARELQLEIVADIHTHPSDWVDLSIVDQEHPIEYRIGLLALVFPNFAAGPTQLSRTGVHEYLGESRWKTLTGRAVHQRVTIVDGRSS